MPEITRTLAARQAVDEFASQLIGASDAALVRIWLMGPGDECPTCAMRPECPSQIRCLHLVSSAGASTRIDDAYRRFPVGARQVGSIATTGEPLLMTSDIAAAGIAAASWLEAHQVRSFAGVPLRSGERILGVLAVFSRRELSPAEVALLSIAASNAARAVEALSRSMGSGSASKPEQAGGSAAPSGTADSAPQSPKTVTLAEAQRHAITRALEQCGGRISGPRGAAAQLGIHPNTLASRMIRLGMRRRRARR